MKNKIVRENISVTKASNQARQGAGCAVSHTFGNVRYVINGTEVDKEQFRELWINGRNTL